MLKRIDLFMPPISQYSVLHHFTRKLAEAFNRIGVSARVLEAEKDNPKPFLDALFSDPPDCTLSFNGLLPDEQGNFLADMIKIPHVAFVVDSPNQYFPLAVSRYTIVASVDQFYCDFFRGLGCPHVIFVPHAVEAELATDPSTQRVFDVVMLGSFNDPEKIRQDWLKICQPELCRIMDEAAEICLMQDKTSYIKAFVEAIARQEGKFGSLNPQTLNYPLIFDQLEAYIRAKERIELVKAIKDSKVNIFGSGAVQMAEKYLRNTNRNVVAHEGVPFEQALEIFKKTKITLNSAPHLKDGSHERVFTALTCGSSVISSESSYLRNIFKAKDSGLLFYSFRDRNKVNDTVNHLLSNDKERLRLVHNKQKIVLDNHTWDQRAQLLSRELAPILQGVS